MFGPEMRRKLIDQSEGVEEADLWEASPIRLDRPSRHDTRLVLEALYKPDDVLFIGPRHAKQVRTVRDWLAESLGEARDVGLEYPYDALTLVEVPQTLRGFAV